MELDLELYRREIRISDRPRIHLSAIDIAPDHPRHTYVFLHGFGGEAAQWRYQLAQFALTNRVIALDLRGHGRSDKPAGSYQMEQIQDDLARALSILEMDSGIVLAGHSFGGAIAAEYAAANPHGVSRLILIATAGEFRLSSFFRFALGLPPHLLRLLRPLTSGWLHAPLPVLRAWYRTNLSQWTGRELFPRLTVPTLVIRGHRDLLFDRPLFEEVAKAIPGAEDLDVGSSRHMVMLERRDAVNRAIFRFVEEKTTRSWRETSRGEEDVERTFRRSRPWLVHYDAGTPETVAVPPIPLHGLLDSAKRRFPQRTALWFEGTEISFAHLNDEVNQAANAYLDLGLSPRDRVMVIGPNLPQTVIAYFATWAAGGIAVIPSLEMDASEVAEIVKSTNSRILVAWRGYAGLRELLDLIPDKTQVVLMQTETYLPRLKRAKASHTASVPGTLAFVDLLRGQGTQPPHVAMSPDEVAVIQYTSGTTDRPKGVMLTHRNLVANTIQTRHWMPEAHEGQERFLSVVPFFHSYGLTASLLLPVAVGATLYLKPRFDVLDVLKTIKRHQPTVFPGVPIMFMAIMNHPDVRKYGIRSIKACICGSAPLPLEVHEAFEKLTRGRLVEGYGLTEASPVTHGTPLHGLRKLGSIGIPLPSTEARIVTIVDRRQEAAEEEIGELVVRGPQIMAGYWDDPDSTAQVLDEDGWLLTGDIVQMDNDGYFHMIARRADMWYPPQQDSPAFPRDIEEVLFEIPQVRDAAVVAIADQPIAFVVADPHSIDGDAVTAYCQRRLPDVLVPHVVHFVDELPRGYTGKVLRRKLVQMEDSYDWLYHLAIQPTTGPLPKGEAP